MTDSSLMTNHVGCYIARTVLGRSGKGFQREVERFLTKNGIEWTNNRLKAIWTAANHLRNERKDLAIQIYQANSISYHKADGTPKGPFRPAVRSYVLAQRAPRIRAHAAVLRFYCGLRLKDLSRQQSEKAYAAITEPPPRYTAALQDGNLEYCIQQDRMLSGLATADLKKSGIRVLTDLQKKVDSGEISQNYEPPIRDRYADGLRPTTYCYSRHRLPKGISCRDPYMSMAQSFMTEPWCPMSIDTLTPCFEMREVVRSQGFDDQRFVGKIGVIQEQGCKARVVAMPSAWVQLAFLPMHTRLNKISSYIEQSCVHNQVRGANILMAHMCDGKDAYGVDLSSATDRFPRHYSLQILRDIGMSNYADALEEVCFQRWTSPWGPVKYATGQPMGLYGSFPLFNVSHAVFAAARCSEVAEGYHPKVERGESPPLDYFHTGSPFYVIGDDVVFSDKRFADHYTRALEKLEIPVSHHKSFGGKVCEFAGFMAIRNKQNQVTVFRPYKVPDESYVKNPIQALHSVGRELSRTSPYWRRKFEEFRRYQNHRDLDLTPFIGEEKGRGTNPYRGDTLTLKNACQCLSMWHEEHVLPDLSGDTRINTIPLFAERGMFDFYGFSPDELRRTEEELRRSAWEPYRVQQLYKDPLMKKASKEMEERLTNALSSSDTTPVREHRLESHSRVDEGYFIKFSILAREFRTELDNAADGCDLIPNFQLLGSAPDGVNLTKKWEEYSLKERFALWKKSIGDEAWSPVTPELRLLLVQRGMGLCVNSDLKGKPPVRGEFPILGIQRSSRRRESERRRETSLAPTRSR